MSSFTDRPDSSRSWVIAGAAFVINILLSGVSRTTGVFYVALIDEYSCTRMEANMPFTLRNIVRNLLGPLVGIIGHRYGAREVTMLGGIFAGVGVSLCAFASDMRWISFLWGGLHGVGVAFGNTLFQVILNQYFQTYRSTASGIAFSGGCVGSFAFPIVLEHMLDRFGLSGAFLITGALLLNVIPAGILMKEPSWITRGKSDGRSSNGQLPSAVVNKALEHQRNEKEDIFIIERAKRVSSDPHDGQCHQGIILQSKETVEDGGQHLKGLEPKKEQNASISSNQTTSIYEGIIDMCSDPLFYMISLSLTSFIILFDLYLSTIVDYTKDKKIHEDLGKYFISLLSVGDFIGRLGFGWVTDKNYISVAKFMTLVHVVQGLSLGALSLVTSVQSSVVLVIVCGLAGGANVVMYPVLVAKYLPLVQSLAFGFISFIGGISYLGIPPMIGYFRDGIGSYDHLYVIIGGLSCLSGALWIMEPVALRMQANINKWRSRRNAQNLSTAL